MKLVVVGAGGRLGAALCRAYAAEHDVTGFSHRELDLGSRDAITTKIGPLEFDVLLNAAGLTNVDYCETHEEEAIQINAHAVRQMAEICAENGARMIHFSTDYVFDGEKKTPYLESDEAKPVSIYGKSKLMGEWELLDVSPDNLAVRVSWVFGPDRPSFIDAILKRAMESDHGRGDCRQVRRAKLHPGHGGLSPSRFLAASGTQACCIFAMREAAVGGTTGSLRSIAQRRRAFR